ncbi:hypothetical protein CYMTET_7567 [Cymbomonas tetramitiformis]|uniref:Uncharacterized protein n=1 Tax=Cymbomonas tetramitiformis TaxID=36881 RepID=A0AAE0GV93_9CHLO|nr:hypothetical protein CYMTET_7567 [Cymbomonas tetramitiformis]
MRTKRNNQVEGRNVGGRSDGPGRRPAVVGGAWTLPVGTLVEVYWPGERNWFGGRVWEGPHEEGATMIEYFDENPKREEVFLEGEPRGPGDHDSRLFKRLGGHHITVEEVNRLGDEAEERLLMGWRWLPQGVGGGEAELMDGGGDVEVSGEDTLGGNLSEDPHLSIQLESSIEEAGHASGAVARQMWALGRERLWKGAGESRRGSGREP